jgi:outer membrane protein assembly factor BamA
MMSYIFLFTLHIVTSDNPIAVDIVGNFFYSDQYLLQNRTIHTIADADSLIKDILRTYNDAGFAFCEIRPEIEQEESVITRLTLMITENDRVTISKQVFLPDHGSIPAVIRQYVHPVENSFFSVKEVQRIKKKLMDTGAYVSIEEQIVYRDDLYHLLWTLQEQQTDFISAYGSISDEDYIFSLAFHSINLLGSLRRLQFLYEYEKLFSIQITEPVLLAPTSVHGNLSLWTYDTVQLFELLGTVATPLWHWIDISLLSGIERASYTDTTVIARNHTLLGGGITVHTAGKRFSTEQTVTVDYLVREHDRWRVIYDGSLQLYDLFVRPHSRYLYSDSLLFFDYFRLGGAKSLRGYFEEDIITTQMTWVNLEYKRIFLFPLVDIGYSDATVFYSYGLGIEARSSFADASLIIAWPRNGSWRDGVLHLTFEKGF